MCNKQVHEIHIFQRNGRIRKNRAVRMHGFVIDCESAGCHFSSQIQVRK
jgi:hypothetical protein